MSWLCQLIPFLVRLRQLQMTGRRNPTRQKSGVLAFAASEFEELRGGSGKVGRAPDSGGCAEVENAGGLAMARIEGSLGKSCDDFSRFPSGQRNASGWTSARSFPPPQIMRRFAARADTAGVEFVGAEKPSRVVRFAPWGGVDSGPVLTLPARKSERKRRGAGKRKTGENKFAETWRVMV